VPKILIVDDDVYMTRLLSMTLPGDCEVVQTNKGQDAFALAEQHHPDIILLDINMPGVNGLEVLRKVKQSEKLKATHVILVTASHDEEDQNLARQLGAVAYFAKPFSPLSLLSKVSNLLGME